MKQMPYAPKTNTFIVDYIMTPLEIETTVQGLILPNISRCRVAYTKQQQHSGHGLVIYCLTTTTISSLIKKWMQPLSNDGCPVLPSYPALPIKALEDRQRVIITQDEALIFFCLPT